MSTVYYTVPNIPWEKIIETKSVNIKDPEKIIYVSGKHKVLHNAGSYIHVFERDNKTLFERYGINNVHNIFPHLIKEFNVIFYDEYGLLYPDESD